uniref:Uncharacterized protein n=1 Tax=Cannabis sativa TaxID=3483 RepID=A0A803QHY2_CANSA
MPQLNNSAPPESHSPAPINQPQQQVPETPLIVPTNISPKPVAGVQHPPRTHSIRTRSQSGIRKPKVYLATKHPLLESLLPIEPRTLKEALNNPHLLAAMSVEFHALIKQGTWTLVPYAPHMNVIDNNWCPLIPEFDKPSCGFHHQQTQSVHSCSYQYTLGGLQEITKEIDMWICHVPRLQSHIMVSKEAIGVDNQSTTSLAANPVFHARCKHIEIDLHFARDQILAHQLALQYVPSLD